ncbi:MAG: NAD(P)H-dependent oxidoreductase [Defluviitaleaceae bacterium]|nr:NAD(P)H-dependent oxidoreductase [Defluviitaleaceae bacterium]
MKIVYIYGNMTHYDHGLGGLLKRTQDVFSELDAQTETVDLGVLHPPYYDGETTNAIDGIMEKIKAADGIVLACTAQNFAPTALIQSFLEYLENAEYTEALKDKHLMIITLSNKGGEKSAGDYLTRVIQFFGGFVVASMGLNVRHLGEMDGDAGEFIDKTTQDFYRAVHQKRKYVIPSDFINETPSAKKIDEPIKEKPELSLKTEAKPLGFTDTQEKEIDELSLLFTKMHSKGEASPAAVINESFLTDAPSNPFAPKAAEKQSVRVTKSGETVQSLTKRLPEFFNSQLSAGLQAVIQFNITGSETFDGAISIHSTECTYIEGNVPAPDIIIMSDAAIWQDVLKNKNSAQKAFMTGGIKVRGDFVLLSKFDSLFKFPE